MLWLKAWLGADIQVHTVSIENRLAESGSPFRTKRECKLRSVAPPINKAGRRWPNSRVGTVGVLIRFFFVYGGRCFRLGATVHSFLTLGLEFLLLYV